MNHGEIKHIIRANYRKLKKISSRMVVDFDTETIHQSRVEYKKLRAFLNMLSSVWETGAWINISKKLQKAYHLSGSLRDLQLQQQRILEATKQEPKMPRAYLRLLQRKAEKLKANLRKLFQEHPVSVNLKKIRAALPDEFPQDGFTKFLQGKYDAVHAAIVKGKFRDDAIHTIRKQLKDAYYIKKRAEKEEGHSSDISLWPWTDEKNNLAEFLNELGRFQDNCTAIALLKPAWINRLNKYNREILARIKKEWIKNKIASKQLLVRQLKTGMEFNSV